MQRRSTLETWCDRVIEAGWLLAVAMIPIYFNLLSARHFEPDKATSLRAIVLLMLGAWMIAALDRLGRQPALRSEAEAVPSNPFAGLWRRLRQTPLALPALIYVAVFLITTATSIVPRTSFFGSYQRLQGTYTNLSYVLLFAMIIATLRRREQIERLITVSLLTSLVVAGYGLIQHFQLDPLPWRGDVITRVASTMGNSIFVAAYMIMIVPLALYRLIDTVNQSRSAPVGRAGNDIGWVVAYVLMIAGCLALLLGVIKFASSVRTADFRYLWVFPGAIIICAWLFALPTLRPRQNGFGAAVLTPGILAVLHGVLLGLIYVASEGSGLQATDNNAVNALDWGWWLAGGVLLIVSFYAIGLILPKDEAPPSQLSLRLQAVGLVVLLFALLTAIFFTQSRGPWLGLFAGMFVFFTLVIWRAMVGARETAPRRHRILRSLLIAELVVALAFGGFLVAFNLSSAPFFTQLRDVPYIGRMGRLLETDDGTGKVRLLIWRGDDKAGGALALIFSEPFHTVFGWGPESMFVAYNRYYPPALANIEARGASPDRSHQAILDELVTKGFLGLISYLFVLIAFMALVWRLIWRSQEWHWQVLFIALLTIVISHFFETLVGIPIVSTLMTFWITLALTVVGGALAGVYQLGAEERAPAVVPVEAEVAPVKPGGKRKGQPQPARRTQRGMPSVQPSRSQQRGLAAWLVYGVVALLTFYGVWLFNFNVVYADMRFQQGQAYGAGADPQQQLAAFVRYLEAIKLDTDEDFYYLNLGRTLMTLADIKRQQTGGQLGEALADAKVNDLLTRSNDEVQAFIVSKSPLEILSYAEAVLERARALNSRNKDHYANLARLSNFWYTITGDQARLQKAEAWYRQAADVAPQDVVIKTEWAGTLTALTKYSEAEQILAQAKNLDPRYPEIDVRMADLLRAQGKLDEALDLYIAMLEKNPHQLDGIVQQLLAQVQDRPDLLDALRGAYEKAASASPNDDVLQNVFGLVAVRSGNMNAAVTAYERAVKVQPASLQYRRNYALVLSDTNQLPAALEQARVALDLAQKQQGGEAEAQALQGLVQFLESQLAVGG